MSVTFPRLQAWDNGLQAVNFLARIEGRTVVCSITSEALANLSGQPCTDPLRAFDQHRDRIEERVLRLVSRNRLEPDGSVVIAASDGETQN